MEDDPPGSLSSSTPERKNKWTRVKKKQREKKVNVHLFATDALVTFWRSVLCNTA